MRVLSVILGASVAAGCNTNTEQSPAATDTNTSALEPQQTNNAAQPILTATTDGKTPGVALGDVASCQPSQEVASLASSWVGLADADGNGRISRQEAQSFANFMLGGFFFRADTDNNGVVTPEEGRAARVEFTNQHPALATLLGQARTAAGQSPFKAVANILDVQYGKPLSLDEARQASRAALDDLFKVVDADKDNTITMEEARAASWQGARNLGQMAFKAVDTNSDGRLDLNEFQATVNDTAKLAFDAADANDNSQLTEEEAAVAIGSVVRRLGIPAPSQKQNQK